MNSSALISNKSRLKPTVTRVTRADGQVHLETEQGSKVAPGHNQEKKSPGYVVDTKPDLTLSQILPWMYLSSQDVAADINILRLVTFQVTQIRLRTQFPFDINKTCL